MNILFLKILVEILFLTIVLLHISKKNIMAIYLYGSQSLVLTILLLNSFLETGALSLLCITLLALVVKVILAPLFFVGLIKKHELKFSVNTYLGIPLTLIIIATITAIARSEQLAALTNIVPANQNVAVFCLGGHIPFDVFNCQSQRGSFANYRHTLFGK